MKKILIAILITKSLFAGSALTNAISSAFSSFIEDTPLDICYQVGTINIPNYGGVCNTLDFQLDRIDACGFFPNIPGGFINKKTSYIDPSASALKDYCNTTASNTEAKLGSVVANSEIWTTDNELENTVYPSGITKEVFYEGTDDKEPVLDIDDLNKKQNESITAMYFASKEPYHQQTAKYLINLAKIKNVSKVTDITTDEVMAAENMLGYEKQVNQLSATFGGDIQVSSANTVSTALSAKLDTYDTQNDQASQNTKASNYTNEVKEIVQNNARAKKGIYKELLAQESDLAVPTQQTLNLYKENVRPKYAMLIRKQQARESYINYLVDTEVAIKSDIIELTAKKSVIMKSAFDETSARNEIDSYVD